MNKNEIENYTHYQNVIKSQSVVEGGNNHKKNMFLPGSQRTKQWRYATWLDA
ncbi:hypothetical protein KATP_33090 [Kluyvera ascorbata]|nr:hypothetical protein KATP_33090 [Kluyvera ascorbata]